MRRSAVSIPSNIAEGSDRNISKDSLQFFFISSDSLYELETQLYISFDLNFLQEKELNELIAQIVVCKKLINGLIKYYETL
ncbi:MAG: hypothetical protein OHK0057_07320 [Thermoflexibacter sp.]